MNRIRAIWRTIATWGTVAMALAAHPMAVAGEHADPRPITRIVEVVREGDLRPIAGARVEALLRRPETVERTTGADGIARFDDMPRCCVIFIARAPGFFHAWNQPGHSPTFVPPFPGTEDQEDDDDTDGDGVTRMRIVLRAGSELKGRVVSAEDGTPIAGIVVEGNEIPQAACRCYETGEPLWRTTTDARGYWKTTEHWPPPPSERLKHETHSASIEAHGAGWIHGEAEVMGRDAGHDEPVQFQLHRAGTVRGVVTGLDGKAVSGAMVYAEAPKPNKPRDAQGGARLSESLPKEAFRNLTATTDSAGEFVLGEAFPGIEYVLHAELEEPGVGLNRFGLTTVARSRLASAVVVHAAGQVISRDLRLRRVGSVTVRVASGAGGEEEDLRIELQPPPGVYPWPLELEEDGVVRFSEVDPASWTLAVDAPGWLPHSEVVEVGEGENVMRTVRLLEGATIEGVVVDDDGGGVLGVKIYAYSVDPRSPDDHFDGYQEAVTDADGAFRVTGLREGPTDLFIGSESDLRQDGAVRVSAPARGVRVVALNECTVDFRLALPPGARYPGTVRVTVTRKEGPLRGTQVQVSAEGGEDGYRIQNLLPGSVFLAVEVKGFMPFVTSLDLKSAVVHRPEPFVLSLGLTLHGHVVDAAGKPRLGVGIVPWGNEERAEYTGWEGEFELPNLAPGPVELSFRKEGIAELLFAATVSADAPPLRIVMLDGGLVQGTVHAREEGEAGIGSIDFFPAASKDDAVSRWRAEVVDGYFEIRLPAGRYRCPWSRLEGERGPFEFEVEEGGETVLEIQL